MSAQKIWTHFDGLDECEIARSFSDSRAFKAVPVSYYSWNTSESGVKTPKTKSNPKSIYAIKKQNVNNNKKKTEENIIEDVFFFYF